MNSASASTGINHVVEVKEVCSDFPTKEGVVKALSNVDLNINAGEFVSFIGPSGCGKTTLMRVLADLEQPTSGSVLVNGMSPAEARKQRAYGYVFQAPALLPWRTVQDNVLLPLEIMGYESGQRQQLAQEYLQLVNLSGFEDKYPWQLSGGMLQRGRRDSAFVIVPWVRRSVEETGMSEAWVGRIQKEKKSRKRKKKKQRE